MSIQYSNSLKKKLCEDICLNGISTSISAKKLDVPLKTLENWITAFNKDSHCFDSIVVNEFKNKIIDDLLKVFNIKRSLSKKGCPYDNAVAKATYKVIKTEFAFNRIFSSFEELELELFDYINWYNTIRIHGSLDYQTPVAYRLQLSL